MLLRKATPNHWKCGWRGQPYPSSSDERGRASEEFRAIRGFRHLGLSYRHDPGKLDPRAMSGARRVKQGDERKVLEATIVAVEGLYGLLGLNDRQDFAKRREEWRDRSRRFWSAIR